MTQLFPTFQLLGSDITALWPVALQIEPPLPKVAGLFCNHAQRKGLVGPGAQLRTIVRKLIIALGAAALMSGVAWAASVDGVVKEYIKETKVITLEDGKSFTVPPDVAIPPEVAVGAKVSISTADDDATKVTGVTLSP